MEPLKKWLFSAPERVVFESFSRMPWQDRRACSGLQQLNEQDRPYAARMPALCGGLPSRRKI